MKLSKKQGITLIVGSVILIVAFFVVNYAFRGTKKTAEKQQASFSITADELYNAFNEDETAANEKYVGKVIEVTGMIAEIETAESGSVVLKLTCNSPMGGISCSFETKQDNVLKRSVKGGETTVKGICSGILMEVVLDKCSLVN